MLRITLSRETQTFSKMVPQPTQNLYLHGQQAAHPGGIAPWCKGGGWKVPWNNTILRG